MKILERIKKHGLSETIKNIQNQLSAVKNYKSGGSKGAKLLSPVGYEKVFEDRFDTPLNKDEWRLQEPWGWFHPNGGNPVQYYDKDGKYTYVSPDGLVLETRKDPITVKKSELPDWQQNPDLPEEFTIDWRVSCVTTKKTFQYGWYSLEVKLPVGQGLWPAFWLSGDETWPPEIDIFEGYSLVDKYYSKEKLFGKKKDWVIQPNLHYGNVDQGTKDQYLAYDCPVFESTDRFVQYVLHWTEDFIKIYYDGVLVFETYNKNILSDYNQKMYIIINNGIYSECSHIDESAMIVKNLQVYQKTN
jgi:beta-glucanase (GH16 family)